jgi:molecular chaperone GrpE
MTDPHDPGTEPPVEPVDAVEPPAGSAADAGLDPTDADAEALVAEAEALLEHDVVTILDERDRFKDMAMRIQADFENYRKRVASQQADEIDRATGKIAEALLPVLDACEAAFSHGATGIESVWSALIGALQKQGLEALDLADQPFDPAVAEAVLHEPGDGGEPVIAEVLRTGYRWKGRVLRPAMVKVRG